MTFKAFDVVAVPFPFTDRKQAKKRPALVLSSARNFNEPVGQSIMAMITSSKNQPWPEDVPIEDLKSAGLPVSSVIRMKLFTLDHRLVEKKLGSLSVRDRKRLLDSLHSVLEDCLS
ncbi:MAG TPA: type II toxin-antitoxin system PemK/MazF family toxin [bacterium]|nr:type II toxin-antitoxin system PemK/MazF family toxin [bacterium]